MVTCLYVITECEGGKDMRRPAVPAIFFLDLKVA